MGKAKRTAKALDGHVAQDIYDYNRVKVCTLFDSDTNADGQAYDIEWTIEKGWKEISFSLPWLIDSKRNYRWNYIKSEFLLRLKWNNYTDWYYIHAPKKTKDGKGITNTVTCGHLSSILKTKNLYMSFDKDGDGIGAINELIERALQNTGWTIGNASTLRFYEKDGVTEKIRSFGSDGKEGTLSLISEICKLFQAYPMYEGETKQVFIYANTDYKPLIEMTMGRDLESLTVGFDSENIITRLYVEGEYGDFGYVGIDDVNEEFPGLTYICNFDYYKQVGLFTATHQAAYDTYRNAIIGAASDVRDAQTELTEAEDMLASQTGLWGLFDHVMWVFDDAGNVQKTFHGTTAKHEYNSDWEQLRVGDAITFFKEDGSYRDTEIVRNGVFPRASGEKYAIKFITYTSGRIGAKHNYVVTQQNIIDDRTAKLANGQLSQAKREQYQADLTLAQTNIALAVNGNPEAEEGTDDYLGMNALMAQALALRVRMDELESVLAAKRLVQDDIESDFILAMGDLLKDGYWNNDNYTVDQIDSLYADSLDVMEQMSQPEVTYSLSISSLCGNIGYTNEQLDIGTAVRIYDPDLGVNDVVHVSKIIRHLDDSSKDTVEVTNKTIDIGSPSFQNIVSRMAQLSDMLQQKNSLYERASAISADGTMYTSRLEGQINLLTTQLSSASSNFYTDSNGNLVFESGDGSSAMMITGAGFMLADGRKDNGEWNWRSAGTGHGFTADEITTGFLSADRIEAGSITTDKVSSNFGASLNLESNNSVRLIARDVVSEMAAPNFTLNISSNMPEVQTYDPNPGGGWAPDWSANHVVLTPVIYYNDELVPTTGNAVTWTQDGSVWVLTAGEETYRVSWSSSKGSFGANETISNGVLTVSANILSSNGNDQVTYSCSISHELSDNRIVVARDSIAFSSVRNKLNIFDADIKIDGPQTFRIDADETVTPASITLTASLTNVTVTQWQYRNTSGSWVQYPGSGTSATLTVLPTDAVFVNDTASIRVTTSNASVYDVVTVTKIRDGKDARTAYLTNENVTFAADKDGKIPFAVTLTTDVVCYVGETQQNIPVGDVVVGTKPSGMTITASKSGNNVRLTVTVAKDATFGSSSEVSGNVPVTLTSPFTANLTLSYSKVLSGQTGAQGPAGTSITVSSIEYQEGTSSTTAPTGTWSSSVVSVAEGKYLWTKTTFSNGSTAYSVARQGENGKDGTSVTILGSYDTVEQLRQAHPTGAPGDSYIVGGNLYVWVMSANSWQNVGKIQGPKGEDGTNGTNGTNGTSSYLYVRYSASSNGSNMTTSPTTSTAYIGICVTEQATAPTSASSYTWSKYVGSDGTDGISFSVYAPDGNVFDDANSSNKTLTATGYLGATPISSGATYQWYKDGTAISGATSSTYSVSRDTVSSSAVYKCIMQYNGGNYTDTITVIDKTDSIIKSDTEPQNPSVGMLWLDTSRGEDKDSDVLYRCTSIVNGEAEWEEVAATVDEMDVLRKQYGEVVSNVDAINRTITNRINSVETTLDGRITETSTQLQQTSDSLTLELNGVTRDLADVSDKVNEYDNYFAFKSSGLEIGKKGQNDFKVNISNEKFSFYDSNEEVAYVSNRDMFISRARVTDTLSIGSETNGWFDWVTLSNGQALKWRELENTTS